MRTLAKVIIGLALVAALLWGLSRLIPSEEKRIQSRLQHLAEVVTFTGKEGNISLASKLNSLMGYFVPDATLLVEQPGFVSLTLDGREEILGTARSAFGSGSGVTVQFADIVPKVAPDKQTSTADLTAKVTVTGDRDYSPLELRFSLRKVDGTWLISRVETLKTFAQ